MKKGDARRQAILQTAERLFFDRGYEEVSVQDILDEMGLSKGGFYHHFESKLMLLEEICGERAQAACARGEQAAREAGEDAVAQLNALFRHGAFFAEENIRYIALMMRTAYGTSLSQLRERMRMTQLKAFEPVLRSILIAGMAQQVFYLSTPDSMARLIILLAGNVTDEVAFILARPQPQPGDMAQIMELLHAYRTAVELMLNAPHGSIELIDMMRVAEVVKSLYVLAGRPLPNEALVPLG